MDDPESESLQHLANLIDGAERNYEVGILREIIKSAADEAPAADVIRMAKFIHRRGTEMRDARRN